MDELQRQADAIFAADRRAETLIEAVRAMRQLGDTLNETVRDYHRTLVELEDIREGMAELDMKVGALDRSLTALREAKGAWAE